MRAVTSHDLDAVLAEPDVPLLTVLYLWGLNCPNCDIAKRALRERPERVQAPDVRWLHGNVYDDMSLGTRFSLHGVPAFFLFRGRRQLGRITGWPGLGEFAQALERQRQQAA